MHSNFAKAKNLIENSRRILLTTHERTDGDDFGSISALAIYLARAGKEAVRAITGGVPEHLVFLPDSQKTLAEFPPRLDFDLLIISGCSNLERAGEARLKEFTQPILNIDHHPDNAQYGALNLVDAQKSSVAELVYDFFRFSGWNIDAKIATCLLTGIFTDTGSFMHSNTRASTLKAAAELMALGARVDKIASHTYQGKNFITLKAWAKALENLYYNTKHKLLYSVVQSDDLADLAQLPAGTFEGFVETLNKAPEAKFAMFLRQDGEAIKGSLRSDPFKGVDVSQIAKLLGGGGHKWASGFTVAGKLTKTQTGQWQIL